MLAISLAYVRLFVQLIAFINTQNWRKMKELRVENRQDF